MKKEKVFILIGLVAVVFFIGSCNKGGKNEHKVSSYNDNESHNAGEDCMSCHKQGGEGEGWFNSAGTVYNELQTMVYPNCTIKFYTGANGTGTLKYTIEVDGKGNYYTTDEIDFGSGLYPVVTSTNGTKYMSTSISSGNCVSCHGGTSNRVWAL